MVTYTTQILKFQSKGEKSGWTYVEVPQDVAEQLSPGNRKPFRVKGLLDNFSIAGVALLPMGDGGFILPLNALMRKGVGKSEGALLSLRLELDAGYKLEMPPELEEYLEEDSAAAAYFNSLAKSHRDYFIKWIESAKTPATREKRIVATANALANGWDYGQMIRSMKVLK